MRNNKSLGLNHQASICNDIEIEQARTPFDVLIFSACPTLELFQLIKQLVRLNCRVNESNRIQEWIFRRAHGFRFPYRRFQNRCFGYLVKKSAGLPEHLVTIPKI